MLFRKVREEARRLLSLLAEVGMTVHRASAGSEKIVASGRGASAPTCMIRCIPKRSTEQEQAGITARAVAVVRAAEEPTVRTRATSAESLARSMEISVFVAERRLPLLISRRSRNRQRRLLRREMRKAEEAEAEGTVTARKGCRPPSTGVRATRSSRSLIVGHTSVTRK